MGQNVKKSAIISLKNTFFVVNLGATVVKNAQGMDRVFRSAR